MTHAELKELLESGAKVTLWGNDVGLDEEGDARINEQYYHPSEFDALFKNAPDGTFVIEKPEPIALIERTGWAQSWSNQGYLFRAVFVKEGHEEAFTEYVKAFRGKQ